MQPLPDPRCRRIGLAGAASLLVLLVTALALAETSPAGLRGPAFSDPDDRLAMPEDWVARPIAYEPWDAGADLVINMDQDIYHTLWPQITRFGREHHLAIHLQEGTCSIAAGMLAKKTADMGGFCCPAGQEDRLPGLRFHTVGIVGIAFIVHPENPVEDVSADQLRRIFQGRIQRWSELTTPAGAKGPDWPIKLITRLHCPKRPGHWRLLLDHKGQFAATAFEVGSIPDMVGEVARSRNAIGWEVLTMVERNRKKYPPVRPLAIGGLRPNDSRALATLRYPFYRTYTITTWDGPGVANARAGQLAAFIVEDFARLDPDQYGLVASRWLREAGWRFHGEELVGEPAETP
ncbi:MAG: substrate-binding domain-containing protein [Thermodesulfobacteriota bacterium]